MTKASYYAPDDVKKHFKRPSKKPKQTKLNPKIKPGNVLILLTGRFKGRRVVFLKQLPSGLLLVTGPYKVNGVPLKRVNQAYVIPTSTNVSLAGLKLDGVDDKYFARAKAVKSGVGKATIFKSRTELSADEKKKIDAKKTKQVEFDKPIFEAVKKTEFLGQYLKSRFTLRNGAKVQDLVF